MWHAYFSLATGRLLSIGSDAPPPDDDLLARGLGKTDFAERPNVSTATEIARWNASTHTFEMVAKPFSDKERYAGRLRLEAEAIERAILEERAVDTTKLEDALTSLKTELSR